MHPFEGGRGGAIRFFAFLSLSVMWEKVEEQRMSGKKGAVTKGPPYAYYYTYSLEILGTTMWHHSYYSSKMDGGCGDPRRR